MRAIPALMIALLFGSLGGCLAFLHSKDWLLALLTYAGAGSLSLVAYYALVLVCLLKTDD